MEQRNHKKEWILMGILVIMAYFYLSVIRYPTELARVIWWRAQLNTEYLWVGVAWLIFTVMFLATGLWYAGSRRNAGADEMSPGKTSGRNDLKKFPGDSWIYFGLTVAAGVWFPFYMEGDQDILFYMLLFLHGTAVYWLLSVTGSTRGNELDERGIGDLLRGFFVLPFSGYPQFFVMSGRLAGFVWQCKRGRSGTIWQVGLGVLISLPVIAIALPLLCSADVYFDLAAKAMLQGLLDTMARWEVVSVLFTIGWTLVLAGYFFGLFYRCTHRKPPQSVGESPAMTAVEANAPAASPMEGESGQRRQIPQVMLAGFLIPVLSLYLLFFGVRLTGITGAMDRIASGDLWISTYAREGFFELCRIAAINFVIFTVARWYSPRAGKGMRVLIGSLGIETMAFVALAFSKMWYYIQAYQSFTFRRAMCCWLLLTLLVTFGLMTWELWNKKVKGIKWGVWFGSVTFLMMAYSNMPLWAP